MDLCNTDVLKILLKKHGFSFSKALGQNFLIKSWVPREIAESSGADGSCAVLEIGPGAGCLTRELSERAGKVVAIELDKRLLPLLDESLSDRDNVEIIGGDIMKIDIKALINEKFGALTPIVCANLPYSITSPALAHLINTKLFERITVMIQREVAMRICAESGDAAYGALSVFVNYHMLPELLFDVTPDCFMPQPRVTSSVVRMTRRQTAAMDIANEKLFFSIVRAAFNQRRKTLANALSGTIGDKDRIEAAMDACSLDMRVRGEALSIAEFARLTNELDKLNRD